MSRRKFQDIDAPESTYLRHESGRFRGSGVWGFTDSDWADDYSMEHLARKDRSSDPYYMSGLRVGSDVGEQVTVVTVIKDGQAPLYEVYRGNVKVAVTSSKAESEEIRERVAEEMREKERKRQLKLHEKYVEKAVKWRSKVASKSAPRKSWSAGGGGRDV